MSDFPQLLAPGVLGAIPIPNRVLMSPMTRCRAYRDGTVPEMTATYFVQRVSAGLLSTGGTVISPEGVGFSGMPGIWTEPQEEAWRDVVEAVHAAGGKIAMQLMHAGRISLNEYQPGGGAPVSSSAVTAATTMLATPDGTPAPAAEPRALDLNEIRGVVAEFAAAARRAKSAGFDAVEIHAGDGYLIDQFLRDGVNQRFDRYGGSAENRARFLLEVTEAVAREVGEDRTGVRLSPTRTANDMRDSDPLGTFSVVVRQLGALRLAWTHLKQVGSDDLTHRLRDAYDAPFVLNGGFTAESANAAIRNDLAVAVSFGSPFIANPDLVARFSSGAPLSESDRTTWFTGGATGYIDYPEYDPALDERR